MTTSGESESDDSEMGRLQGISLSSDSHMLTCSSQLSILIYGSCYKVNLHV